MDMILMLLAVFGPACVAVGYMWYQKQRRRIPTLVIYVNLLHRYKDPKHPKLVALYQAGDENFQRRARQLHELWTLRIKLPNYTQYIADIKPEHQDAMLQFIDTGEIEEGSEFEHEVDTNPVYQKVLEDVIRLQTRRLRIVFDTLGKP